MGALIRVKADGVLMNDDTYFLDLVDLAVPRLGERAADLAGVAAREARTGVARAGAACAARTGLADLAAAVLLTGLTDRAAAFLTGAALVSTTFLATAFLGAAAAFFGTDTLAATGAAFFLGTATGFLDRIERDGETSESVSASSELFDWCLAPPGTVRAAEALAANFPLPISDLNTVKTQK